MQRPCSANAGNAANEPAPFSFHRLPGNLRNLCNLRINYLRSSVAADYLRVGAYRVTETSIFLASPASTSTSAEPFSLFASQVTKYLPAGKYKRGVES